ncbi:DUF2141 domain-containing protein [Roseomonas chloroacetimidivorans]|uniref:DUF2141 domain-containing protein n=1 Tax=Roseomonas chloroacetimidivorans TaxID=1766656 RepID=UPI003C743FBE
MSRADSDSVTAGLCSARTIGAGPQARQFGPGSRFRPAHRPTLALLLIAAPLLIAAAPATASEPRAAACAAPDAPEGPRLRVTVTGARRVAGNATITIYGPRPEKFLAHRAYLARQRITLQGPSAEACFALSSPGDYAIAVYHDENNDHDFNRTLIGLPAEGYGFSNDAPTTVGLPSFGDVRFTVPSGESRMTIHLRY